MVIMSSVNNSDSIKQQEIQEENLQQNQQEQEILAEGIAAQTINDTVGQFDKIEQNQFNLNNPNSYQPL